MSYAGIQACCSMNCMPPLAKSKLVNSGTDTASVASAIARPAQRAICARPLPSSSNAKPPRIGSHTRRLSRGQFATSIRSVVFGACRGSGPELDQHCEQHDQAEDHHEGIVEEEAGLRPAHDGGDRADQLRAAVDDQSVDDMGVEGPRQRAQADAATGEAIDPEAVEAVLV